MPSFTDCPLDAESVKAATLALLEAHLDITAIFGCNAETVLQVVCAAKTMRRTVPETLSVIGFDDICPGPTRYPRPYHEAHS
jgi:DNA-binding LacI/PurR family transcriptional regulator